MEKLQEVWEAKDLDAVLGMFTDDFEMKMLHLNQTLKGPAAHDYWKEMVLDEGTVSSDFKIIYENDDCAVTYERMTGELSGQVSIVQLWRDSTIYYMEVSVIEDPKWWLWGAGHLEIEEEAAGHKQLFNSATSDGPFNQHWWDS